MKSKKFPQVLQILLPLIAAILSATPWAVKLNFAPGPGETLVMYYSAFDMTPVGYAVWGAMGGGIGAIVLTVLAVVSAVKQDANVKGAMLTISIIAALLSLSTALLGAMTLTGGIITALLAADTLVLYLTKRERE